MWRTLKQKIPKNLNTVPVGKKVENGKIVTHHSELKQLYLKTFVQRLRERPIKEKLENLKELKEDLFKERLKLSLEERTKPLTMADLKSAL